MLKQEGSVKPLHLDTPAPDQARVESLRKRYRAMLEDGTIDQLLSPAPQVESKPARRGEPRSASRGAPSSFSRRKGPQPKARNYFQ